MEKVKKIAGVYEQIYDVGCQKIRTSNVKNLKILRGPFLGQIDDVAC